MKILVLIAGLLASNLAFAQTSQQPASGSLNYNYLELRFVDVDTAGGNGLRFGGSYDFGNNWLLVGGVTSVDFNDNVDGTWYEIGPAYVWHYNNDFDFIASVRYVTLDIHDVGFSFDDNGIAFSAGTRGLLTPQFEIRGSVNHTTAGDSDTFLEFAGDYHFNRQFAAGLSLEFAGDNDMITIGGRWFFK